MTDWIAISISILSFILSLFTLYITNQKNNAQVELEIKKMIDEKKQKINKQTKDLKINNLIEEELNAYDKACALYLDRKVDKKRFKKDYYYEICEIFENKNMQNVGKLNDKNCKYNNIVEVYNEWKEEVRLCLMK